MGGSIGEAAAPCSLQLAGGWAVALDRRVSARIQLLPEGFEIEWKERLLRARGAGLDRLEGASGLGFAVAVLAGCGLKSGARVALECRVPDESGLGPVETLGVALRGALEAAGAAVGPGWQRLPPERSGASLLGGVVGVQGPGQPGRLACDPARVEEALVLVESGRPAPLAPVAPRPLALGERLLDRDWTGLGRLIATCWAPLPSELEPLGATARRLGGGAWLVADSGGLLAAWLPRGGGRAEYLAEARAAGLRAVACRLDLRGRASRGGA